MPPEELLKEVRIFKYLTPGEREIVAKKLIKKSFAKGTVIFEEKSPGDEMFLITDGVAEVSIARNDARLVLAELGKGLFFGEMALLTEKVRSATVTAMIDCEVFVLKRNDFQELVKEYPQLACGLLLALSEVLCDRILATNENLETYFLINRAIVDNEQFRQLYIHSQTKS